MEIQFSELLYELDVSNVKQSVVPKITDQNTDPSLSHELVLCYYPDPEQKIQLAFMAWRVATLKRSCYSTSTSRSTQMFEVAEKIFTATLECLKSLLLPFTGGNRGLTNELCARLFNEYQRAFEKYINKWDIIHRPDGIWVDEKSNDVFLAPYKSGVVLGLNPIDYVFIYG